jgi:hypothetical protein
MKTLKVIAIIVIVFVVFRVGVELLANYRLANSKEHQESIRSVQENLDEMSRHADEATRYLTPEDRRAIENVVK